MKVGVVMLLIAQRSVASASKESVDAGKKLLYDLDSNFTHTEPSQLEDVEFKESRNPKNEGVAVMHYRFPGQSKKAILACLAADAGVIVLNAKNGEYEYKGVKCVQIKATEDARGTSLMKAK